MTHDPSPRESLTPEEQALARRLAQLGPKAEPSPALDARILAAARDAGSPVRRIHPRPWPIAFGVAASLLLALGIAWELRPLPGPLVEAPASSPRETAAYPIPAPPAAPPPPRAEAVVPTPTPMPPPTVALRKPAPPTQAAEVAPPPPPESAVVLDAPVPVAAAPAKTAPLSAAPAGLPPPPPSPPAASAQSEGAPAAMRKAAAVSEPEPEDNAVNAAAAAEQATGDEPDTDVPPATADSPDVRQAWLQRIRELAAAGQTDAARASLKEFVRRHPDAPLPDDLRALQR